MILFFQKQVRSSRMDLHYLIFIAYISCALATQWVDPHDMNVNVKEKYVKSNLKRSSSTSSIHSEATDPTHQISHSHLKRIVSILMNSAYIDKRNPNEYYGHIRFTIEPEMLDFLMTFSKDDISLAKLRKLDAVFTKSFKRTYIDEYLDTIESYQIKLYTIVMNIRNLWFLVGMFVLYVVFQLFKNDFSFGYIVKYLFIVLFCADFVFRYHYLLEDAEEHNQHVAYSRDCDTKKMSWGEWTKFVLSRKDCEKKTVTPLDPFLYQVKNLIIIPMHAFGEGMGGFGKNMFTNLPWGLNLILWPVLLIFLLIFVFFLMFFWTDQLVEFNILHLLKLKRGGDKCHEHTKSASQKLTDKDPHRPMVQNVQVIFPHGGAGDNKDRDKYNEQTFVSVTAECLNGKGENISEEMPKLLGLKARSSNPNVFQMDDNNLNVKKGSSDKGTNTCYIPNASHSDEDSRDSEDNSNSSQCARSKSICFSSDKEDKTENEG